jgi:hypothetical protein
MPLQATSGAASYDAFGGGAAAVPQYIEDVFSTQVYTGSGLSVDRTITNGIDLASKGGIVWTKYRNAANAHVINSTPLGFSDYLVPNDTGGLGGSIVTMTANSDGYTLNDTNGSWNESGGLFVSWTFRKQPKFFDVVTYTGNGASNRSISHNLGSTPGCIIVKRTDAAESWIVWHRAMYSDPSILFEYYLRLNSTAAIASTYNDIWGNSNNVTSTSFQVSVSDAVNASGGTYVAYLFAHNAGGFGLTGTDNVISCGSYTGTGATGNTITLGYEPQWVMIKRASGSTADWRIYDVMRNVGQLEPNTSDAEAGDPLQNALAIQATGFGIVDYTSGSLNANGSTYIYIAIRRGPMKVPTSGTSVFSPTLVTGNGTNDRQITGVGFSPDLLIGKTRGTVLQPLWYDKLRGKGKWVESNNTLAEQTLGGGSEGLMLQDGFVVDNNYGSLNINTRTYVNYLFKRAPGFFDEVCYTGTGSATTFTHNLGVVPELMIVKRRNSTGEWKVYTTATGNGNELVLNSTGSVSATDAWNDTTPTASVFSIGFPLEISSATYVAYLFATCAGVSKVGSYTGTATTKQIDCGFTAGARFVLIKRTDSTGDWYVWDTARGIVSGNDPYLLLNSTAAEVTSTDYIDTYSAGFEISSTAPAAINASGGSFIFFAVS